MFSSASFKRAGAAITLSAALAQSVHADFIVNPNNEYTGQGSGVLTVNGAEQGNILAANNWTGARVFNVSADGGMFINMRAGAKNPRLVLQDGQTGRLATSGKLDADAGKSALLDASTTNLRLIAQKVDSQGVPADFVAVPEQALSDLVASRTSATIDQHESDNAVVVIQRATSLPQSTTHKDGDLVMVTTGSDRGLHAWDAAASQWDRLF